MPNRQGTLSALVIAGTHSGVGKTSITLGLIGALAKRGLTVQAFKVGPDFIDPLHHQQASGRAGVNLDTWMLSPADNRASFARASADADVAVIEGVMGLFDGSEGGSERGSTAELAKLLGLPVLLVVDVSAMARSAGALIQGYATFDRDLELAGVILNNVGGQAHADMVRDAVAGVPILGALPNAPEVVMPERHLGLHLPHEANLNYVDRLSTLVQTHIDLDLLLAQSATARPAPAPARPPASKSTVRMGVARDEAFCFYYPENLELLRAAGAELVEFSPISDPLPDGLDGLYLGGGYPELHAPALSNNQAARDGIGELAASGRPVYAECGGLMYLARALELDGAFYPFCGVLPFETRMPAALQIAYVEIETTGGLFGAGQNARGHLFHQSEISTPEATGGLLKLRNTRGEETIEGYGHENVLASYVHLHFASNPALAAAFVSRASR